MAIYIDEQKKLFTLSTNNTSYQMMADKYLVLNHLYYGENIGQEDMSYLLDYQDRGFSGNPYEAGNERDYSLDSSPSIWVDPALLLMLVPSGWALIT